MRKAVALVALTLFAPHVRADVTSIVAGRDVTLYESSTGALANGAGQHVYAGRTSQNLVRRAIFFFDIAGTVPAGSTVTAVSLQLSQTLTQGSPIDFTLFRATANWGEGTSNAGLPGGMGTTATPGDATWIHTFNPGSFWATPGGDFAPTGSATTTVGAPLTAYTWSSAQMIVDVQGWLTNPAANFGWFLRGPETVVQDASRFASRENATPALRPTLTVTFTPIPEPSAILLLGFAVVGVAARRRRR